MRDDTTKSPRLYTDLDLTQDTPVSLETAQAHYLKNVLRKNAGDAVRLFNGKHGEWLSVIDEISKKSVTLIPQKQISTQPNSNREIHLYFAPIKKNRMDFLIEKSVELGVTDLHPILTQNTEMRKINTDRLRAQIIEAAEQCERLILPKLHPLNDLTKEIMHTQDVFFAALERGNYPHLRDRADNNKAARIIIGPEGGFSAEELEFLKTQDHVHPITLGDTILRAETAALKALSLL